MYSGKLWVQLYLLLSTKETGCELHSKYILGRTDYTDDTDIFKVYCVLCIVYSSLLKCIEPTSFRKELAST